LHALVGALDETGSSPIVLAGLDPAIQTRQRHAAEQPGSPAQDP
jgi:hypothetical protein